MIYSKLKTHYAKTFLLQFLVFGCAFVKILQNIPILFRIFTSAHSKTKNFVTKVFAQWVFIPKILSLALVVFLGGVLVVHAAENKGVLLAPLPIGENGALFNPAVYPQIGTYLAGMMKFMIALGGVISIVIAIIGGVQRIASGISPSAKADANKRIEDALVGLALVLTSYLILNSINPNLVKINFNLPVIEGTRRAVSTTTTTATEIINDQIVTAGLLMNTSLLPEDYWGGDKYWRDELFAGGKGVTIQRPNSCKKIGEEACTSVSNLGQSAIDGLIKLAVNCKCTPIITGGTEFWLHGNRSTDISANPTQHKPGNSVVDLSQNSSVLNTFIKNTLTTEKTPSGIKYYPPSGGVYLDEKIDGNTPHWHVTF